MRDGLETWSALGCFEDVADRPGKVLCVKVRERRAPLGTDENGARAGPVAGLDVVLYIADDPGGREVDAVLAGGPAEHAGRGLAAGALDSIGGGDALRVVGTVLQIVQGGPACVEHPLEPVMHTVYRRLVEVAAGHPRLVRDEH